MAIDEDIAITDQCFCNSNGRCSAGCGSVAGAFCDEERGFQCYEVITITPPPVTPPPQVVTPSPVQQFINICCANDALALYNCLEITVALGTTCESLNKYSCAGTCGATPPPVTPPPVVTPPPITPPPATTPPPVTPPPIVTTASPTPPPITQPQTSIALEQTTGGFIGIDIGTATGAVNRNITLKATPQNGYQFVRFEVIDVSEVFSTPAPIVPTPPPVVTPSPVTPSPTTTPPPVQQFTVFAQTANQAVNSIEEVCLPEFQAVATELYTDGTALYVDLRPTMAPYGYWGLGGGGWLKWNGNWPPQQGDCNYGSGGSGGCSPLYGDCGNVAGLSCCAGLICSNGTCVTNYKY